MIRDAIAGTCIFVLLALALWSTPDNPPQVQPAPTGQNAPIWRY